MEVDFGWCGAAIAQGDGFRYVVSRDLIFFVFVTNTNQLFVLKMAFVRGCCR